MILLVFTGYGTVELGMWLQVLTTFCLRKYTVYITTPYFSC